VPELSFEVGWPVGDLHQPVGGAVRELPADGGGRRAFQEFVRGPVGVVGEEHPAPWFQAVSHQRPERCEALGRDVREPEAEEDHLVAAVRGPGEEVGLHEADPLGTDPGGRDGEHLRGGVDGGDLARVAEQVAGPHPRTAGQLEHPAGWPEGVQGCDQLVAAGKLQALMQIVRGQGPVVAELLV